MAQLWGLYGDLQCLSSNPNHRTGNDLLPDLFSSLKLTAVSIPVANYLFYNEESDKCKFREKKLDSTYKHEINVTFCIAYEYN